MYTFAGGLVVVVVAVVGVVFSSLAEMGSDET